MNQGPSSTRSFPIDSHALLEARAWKAELVLALDAIEKVIAQWRNDDIQKLRTRIEDASPAVARAEIWSDLYATRRRTSAGETVNADAEALSKRLEAGRAMIVQALENGDAAIPADASNLGLARILAAFYETRVSLLTSKDVA